MSKAAARRQRRVERINARFNPYHDASGKFAAGGAESELQKMEAGKNVNLQPNQVAGVLAQETKDKATVNLAHLGVQGTYLFKGDTDTPRIDMPQIPNDQRDSFLADLRSEGITSHEAIIPADELHPTQSEIDGNKATGIAAAARAGTYDPTKSDLFVTNDNHILDGHHRWAAVEVNEALQPNAPKALMHATVLDAPIDKVLTLANQWDSANGIQHYAMGGNAAGGATQIDDQTKRFNPNHDEHGKFAAGSGGTATATKTAYTVNGFTPKIVDLQTSAEQWGGYQESIEARFAADEMLGEYSDYGYELATPEVVNVITGGPKDDTPAWVTQQAQDDYDRAATLLNGVHNAEPTTLPLYRGVSEEAPMMGAGLDGLAKGDHFDISLASFSGDKSIAEGYLPEQGSPGGYMFQLAPGAQAVPVEGTETEAQVNGEWQQVPGDAITSGRFEVTGRTGNTIYIKQAGTFAPPVSI